MSRIKFLGSSFDKKTGVSQTTISTPLGTFTGYARLHPEDKDFPSSYAGCAIAEMRANIQYQKRKKKRIAFRLTILKEMQDKLNNNILKYGKTREIMQETFLKETTKCNRDLAQIDKTILELRKEISKLIDSRNSIIKRIKDKDEKWAKLNK